MKISRLGLYACLTALLLLDSCQRKHISPAVANRTASQDSLPTPGGVLVAALNHEPENLNPIGALSEAARQVIGLLFLRLARPDSNLIDCQSELAQRWDTLANGSIIRFHLRSDVFWQDGVKVTAKDVAFTYLLQTSPAYGWDGLTFKKNIARVEVINDSTIDFYFQRRNLSMVMDAAEGEILPAHLLANLTPEEFFNHHFNRQPVGNGPYQLLEWRPQQLLILQRNPRYYDHPRPYLDQVIFKIIPDNVMLARQVLSGELDLAENLLPRDFQRLQERWTKGQSPIRPLTYLGRQYDFIAWNLIEPKAWADAQKLPIPQELHRLTPHHLFGSRQVRRALTMAIDRQRIGEIVNGALFKPMHGPIPLIMWAYNPTAVQVYNYDPAQARALLAAEGWRDTDGDGILDKDGVPFQFEMLTNSGNIRRQQALTLIQEQLRQVGIKLVPRQIEPQLLIERYIVPRQFDAILFGWNVSLKMELTGLFHSSTFSHPFHFTSYHSAAFDKWEDQALQATSFDQAQIYWNKIANLLSEELPYTWLYYQVNSVAVHRRFRGIALDNRGIYHNLPEWWIPVGERLPRDQYFSKLP